MFVVPGLKFFLGLLIVIVILLGGWLPFKKKITATDHIDFPIGETLATGIFLGAALLHMLPEANSLFKHMGYRYPWAFAITGAVFLIFLWFEHLVKELYHHHHANHPAFAILAWVMLSVHSVMLGTALGLAQHQSMIIMLFLAIITHKWAESFAVAMQLNKSTMSATTNVIFFLLFSLMTPLGIYCGWFFGHGLETNSLLDPLLLSASAGTFLYLGTLHGLERCVLVERCCNLRDFSFVIIGFLLMASVAFYL